MGKLSVNKYISRGDELKKNKKGGDTGAFTVPNLKEDAFSSFLYQCSIFESDSCMITGLLNEWKKLQNAFGEWKESLLGFALPYKIQSLKCIGLSSYSHMRGIALAAKI